MLAFVFFNNVFHSTPEISDLLVDYMCVGADVKREGK
jgi:hypothetical protein